MKREAEVRLRAAYAAASVLLFLYFLMWQLNFYLAENIKHGVYLFFAPVLVAGALYFCGTRGRIENRMAVLYMLWIVVSRVLNGDRVLSREYLFVLDLSLMIPMLFLGQKLDRAGRSRVLNWLSVILGVYFFLFGCLVISAYVFKRSFLNPITGAYLGRIINPTTAPMATILDTNPNTVAFWFMIPFMLMIYQFFTCRNHFWRIPITISALTDFMAIGLTKCRSVKLSLALSLALLAVVLLRSLLENKKRALTAFLLAVVFCCTVPLVDCCFGWSVKGLTAVQTVVQDRKEREAAPAQTSALPAYFASNLAAAHFDEAEVSKPVEENESFARLNRLSSGRLLLFRAALQSLREEPAVLLRGKAADEVMDHTNSILPSPKVQFHNYLLHTLMLAGLPGLMIVLLFTVLLLLRAFRLCFGRNAPIHGVCLALPVLASVFFGQFEAGFFNSTDARCLFFYLMCGMMLGEYYDRWPKKE